MDLMSKLKGVTKLFKGKKKDDDAEELETINYEYRRNVFRTDDQRMAAFYFSDENQEIQQKGCSVEALKGCFKKEEEEAPKVVETKPFFDAEFKGCFKKPVLHSMNDSEYDQLVSKMVSGMNFKEKAMEALLLDESEVKEIEPIHFGYSKYGDLTKLKLGKDFHFRTSSWQETWIFFTKTSLLAYQCDFYTDRNDKKETTYEYQYKDITSVKVIEKNEEKIDDDGQRFKKYCEFVISVPGDSLTCTFANNEEQVNSVKGMKSIIRDKKNN